ncbi:GAF domain-containing protein, partial [Nonomuraea sp. NPDC003804]|uniref:sensor histidine kinase n=1 Tax=Nonomuraea sp. NPDC003804 TaxID=3154547 RepID=UPI0033AD7F3F
TAAGVAVENARLYEETRRRETWLQASSEITTSLLSGAASHDVLRMLAASARRMTGADAAMVLLPEAPGEGLSVAVAEGEDAEDLLGTGFPLEGSAVGAVYTNGESRLEKSMHDSSGPDAPGLLVPLGTALPVRGVLALVKQPGRMPFTGADVEMLGSFAAQAALAFELAETRKDAERLGLLEDRDRIAKDLHDVVIQRLFAVAMTLMGAVRLVEHPEAADRVQHAIDELDETIRQIRSTIFALQVPRDSGSPSLRARVVDLVENARGHLGFMPGLRMEGPLDHQVPEEVAAHLLAVLREALSNVVRHAKASRAEVSVEIADGTLTLVVQDDGVGMGDGGHRSGLRNLEDRAAQLNGVLEVEEPAGGGTRICWRVPL